VVFFMAEMCLGVACFDKEWYQRVASPSEVIKTKSGLCIETSLALASALRAMDMNALIILSPGHAQVAVETWSDSGYYYLVETTALSSAENFDFSQVISYKDPEEWKEFLSQEGVQAIDCNLANYFEIKPLNFN